MKKIICMLLACMLCVTALGGCTRGSASLTKEDFYTYDEVGNVIEEESGSFRKMIEGWKVYDYPDYSGNPNYPDWHTKRGIYVGDSAYKILFLYPMDEAECFGYDQNDDEKLNQYDTISEKIQHSGEIARGIEIFFGVVEDKEGKLFTYKEVEEGLVDETNIVRKSYLAFTIKDKKVYSIVLWRRTLSN